MHPSVLSPGIDTGTPISGHRRRPSLLAVKLPNLNEQAISQCQLPIKPHLQGNEKKETEEEESHPKKVID